MPVVTDATAYTRRELAAAMAECERGGLDDLYLAKSRIRRLFQSSHPLEIAMCMEQAQGRIGYAIECLESLEGGREDDSFRASARVGAAQARALLNMEAAR